MKYLERWQIYGLWRHQRREEYKKADLHYYLTIVSKCMNTLFNYSEVKKERREMNAVSQDHLRSVRICCLLR